MFKHLDEVIIANNGKVKVQIEKMNPEEINNISFTLE